MSGMGASERIFSIISQHEMPDGEQFSETVTEVEFQQVSFEYPSRAGVVLKQFSMVLQLGQMQALVGPSGSGKVTASSAKRTVARTQSLVQVGGFLLLPCVISEYLFRPF